MKALDEYILMVLFMLLLKQIVSLFNRFGRRNMTVKGLKMDKRFLADDFLCQSFIVRCTAHRHEDPWQGDEDRSSPQTEPNINSTRDHFMTRSSYQ